ncbi:glycoside hydrolase family 114 protein [Aaosphaeria arxii CBS 175.79]|uniref:alpha-galactosidase n=1 Tax=Aaosphaeria arxii CBS 175.79 TaxID=1450172 RepID=A0A6A5XXD9_9PLEO|nr:glycoside hydrolase family 114 protein [Aaosphaeria arxii CBS 175.79]KAF2017563.1 glycoside hydrolase family 114 protein [Aaosphaeria arxii CBS 175.79]
MADSQDSKLAVGPNPSPNRHSRKKWLIILAAAFLVIAIGLGVGLGVGLTRNGGSDDGDNDSGPTPTSSPLPTPTSRLAWRPKVNDTWQIMLLHPPSLNADAASVTPDVDIFDIDLFDTTKETIHTLHKLGKKVICYFSGGSYEPYRPDSAEFEKNDIGADLQGWPGEKWIKLGSENVRRIMKGRVELAHHKGCDGVDPDNVDGFQNENGLSLTADDSISFMSYLSNITSPLNLTLGLKNAGDIIKNVLPIVHFSVNEQCVEHSECSTFAAFIQDDKPVFHIEYPDGAGKEGLRANTVNKYCSREGDARGSDQFSTVLKTMDLNGWVETCDGTVMTTTMNETSPNH